MRSNRSGLKVSVVALVTVLLLSLPFVAAAQTTGGSASATTSTAAATNGITSPKDMAALSGTVQVQGYANSPSFMKWQLDLLPGGDPNGAIFLAFGETPGEFTYSFDTSKLPAGQHALRLRVVRQDSNYDEFLTRFTIGQASSGAAAGTAGSGKSTGASTTTGGGTAATTTGTARGSTTSTTTGAPTSGAGVTTNGLAAPREGQAVNGQFVVRGYASDPNFMKWQLDLLPNGDPNGAIFLALGETSGVFTYTLNTTNYPAGQHALRLRVVRNDSNYNEYTTSFTIGQTAAGTGATGTAAGGTAGSTAGSGASAGAGAPGGGSTAGTGATGSQTTNGITAPKEGATVRGSVNVTGYAAAPSFMKWQLDLLPGGDATQAAFLAVGEMPGQFTYTLDTTNLPAGEHALRLRVVRSDSNYDEYITKFTIAK